MLLQAYYVILNFLRCSYSSCSATQIHHGVLLFIDQVVYIVLGVVAI
jgi:hypothetical protein